MAHYRFIIVDDHPLFRGALGQALGAAFENAEILEAGSLDELTDRLALAGETDLILLDLSMPGVHGVSGLLYLRAQHPEVPVVIVSASDDAGTIRQCLDCGASGFIPKDWGAADISRAVRMVGLGLTVFEPQADGPIATPLSPREREVLELIASGATNRTVPYDA